MNGRQPFNNTRLHAKYGGIVRIAPDELSLNTAEGWRDIYGNRVGKPEMPKDKLFYGELVTDDELILKRKTTTLT